MPLPRRAIQALLNQRVHRVASLWKITRTDGTILRFTDHNRTITFDNQVFVPTAGVISSAREFQDSLAPSNLELVGVINSSYITHDDLHANRYRNAEIEEILVNWRYPWAGAIRRNVFIVSDTTFDGEKWQAQVESKRLKLRQARGEVFTRNCRYRLGDAKCTVDLDALETVGHEVTNVLSTRRVFESDIVAGPTDTPLPAGAFFDLGVDGHFDNGQVTFTSGNNNGITAEIKSYTSLNGKVELQIDLPFDLQVGDIFSIKPGCDQLWATCKGKFANNDNFGGFRTIVGTDRALQTP